MKSLIAIALLSATLSALISGCQLRSGTFTDTLELAAQKTTLEEASNTLGFAIPVPSYLPEGYKIQEVYIQDSSVRLLISDKEIEKKLVAHSDAAGTRQRYEFQSKMEMAISWHSKGVAGGLKLPGDRVTIGTAQGVIVDSSDHNDLWWQPRPDPGQPGMFEIALSASKRIPKEELVKIVQSVPIPVVREYPLEVMRAAYDEITKELFDKRGLYDKVSMMGYGTGEISLSFYAKADPEIVGIAKRMIDSKVPGARLIVKENVSAPTPKFPVTTPVPSAISLEIESPKNKAEFNVNLVKVAGTVSDPGARVTVNYNEAKVAEDGSFYAFVELVKGSNAIRAMAEKEDGQRLSKMFTVTFNPELAVYLNHPYPGDSSVDYTREPITIIGYINQTEAKVTVNGIEAKVEQDGAFSARVQLTLGTNSIQAVAKLGEKADEITYIVGVSPEGRLYPIPGLGAGGPRYQSRVIADESIKIKAGETKSLDVTLEVRKDIREPASFSYKILRVAKEYGKDELPIPEGMKISIEPSRFTIYPNTAYQSTIIIKTSRELVPGEYFFKFEKYYRDAHWMGSWIELSLEP